MEFDDLIQGLVDLGTQPMSLEQLTLLQHALWDAHSRIRVQLKEQTLNEWNTLRTSKNR